MCVSSKFAKLYFAAHQVKCGTSLMKYNFLV